MKPLSEQEQQSKQKNSKVDQAPKIEAANVVKPKMEIHERMQHIGREFVDICHYIILFLISVVVVWTAGKEFFVN